MATVYLSAETKTASQSMVSSVQLILHVNSLSMWREVTTDKDSSLKVKLICIHLKSVTIQMNVSNILFFL